jgi:DNA-nicking Smr family endonuclease
MGKKDSKHSNSSDRALFRDAVAGSRPLETSPRHPLSRNEPRIEPRSEKKFERPPQPDKAESTPHAQTGYPGDSFGEELSFNRGSVSRKKMRELRRGKLAVRDALDLHGLTQPQARQILSTFLADSVARKYPCVRIVHGKGLRSGPGGPALKALVNGELRACADVVAFNSAPRSDGGTGAVYVLLKTR